MLIELANGYKATPEVVARVFVAHNPADVADLDVSLLVGRSGVVIERKPAHTDGVSPHHTAPTYIL